MNTYQIDRLRVIIADDGRIMSIRRRPAGYALTISEQVQNASPLRMVSPPEATKGSGHMQAAAFGSAHFPSILVITSAWTNDSGLAINRKFRAGDQQSKEERVDFLEFEYKFGAGAQNGIPLLIFSDYESHEFSSNRAIIYTFPYMIHLLIDADKDCQWTFASSVNASDERVLVIYTQQACTARVSVCVISRENEVRDSCTIMVPAPLEKKEFTLAALCPSVLGSALKKTPAQGISVPPPVLIFIPPTKEYQVATGAKWSINWLRNKWNRVHLETSHSPNCYPFGELLGLSSACVYFLRERIDETLTNIIESVKASKGGLLQSIIVIPLTEEKRRQGTSSVNVVQLNQTSALNVLESPVSPEDLANTIREVNDCLDGIIFGSSDRKTIQQELQQGGRLAPINIPITEDSVNVAPLIVAARLRGAFRLVTKEPPLDQPWPLSVAVNGEVSAVEVAKAVLTDLRVHELQRESKSTEDYTQMWLRCFHEISSGKTRAERLILVGVSNIDPKIDRIKLLPALFHAGQVPCPVLPFRFGVLECERLMSVFADHMKAVANVVSPALHAPRKDIISERNLIKLNISDAALQNELRKIIPMEIVNLIEALRPKEIINYSYLPLEWLRLDGIPLAYLTDISAIRSRTPGGDLGYCGDLASNYDSAIDQKLHEFEAPQFKVVVVAPNYNDVSQKLLNEYINKLAASVLKAFGEEREKGREIDVEEALHFVTVEQVGRLLSTKANLFVYIGHARPGSLEVSDGCASLELLREKAFNGKTFIFIGCETQGLWDPKGSFSSYVASGGAKGVISMSYIIPLNLAREILGSLIRQLVSGNVQLGAAVQIARVDVLHDLGIYFHAQAIGKRIRDGVAFLVAPDPKDYYGGWDAAVRNAEHWFKGAERGRDQMFLPGLSLALAGNPRQRLMNF